MSCLVKVLKAQCPQNHSTYPVIGMIVDPEEDKLATLEEEAAKLKTTLKILNFVHLTCVIKYTGLLKNIEGCNGLLTSSMRSAIEYRWYKLVEQEKSKWNTKYVSDETKNLQLRKALDQVKTISTLLFGGLFTSTGQIRKGRTILGAKGLRRGQTTKYNQDGWVRRSTG